MKYHFLRTWSGVLVQYKNVKDGKRMLLDVWLLNNSCGKVVIIDDLELFWAMSQVIGSQLLIALLSSMANLKSKFLN
jgi:hypothetical protein